MKLLYRTTCALMFTGVLSICNCTNLQAQGRKPEYRSSLEFSAGIWTGSEPLASTPLADFILRNHAADPFNAEMAYSYRLNERYALTAGIALLTAQSADVIDPLGYYPESRQTSLVFPVLLGARYYFRPLDELFPVTPYLPRQSA